MDDVAHKLFRGVKADRRHPTRAIEGTVTEVTPDGQHARVSFGDQHEGALVRLDGVTAIGARVQVTTGTDGRPVGAIAGGAIPEGAELVPVGPTGHAVLGQRLDISQNVAELAAARAQLDAARAEIDAAQSDLDSAQALLDAMVGDGGELPPLLAERLFARIAIVEKLQATGGIITTDMIASGAVTADKVTVTSELVAAIASILELAAEQIYVGPDIRFTSSGLVFYAPAEDGQDPADWASRTPLVSITPGGDVSIAVARDGAVTAGITPDGTVWGLEGRFSSLQVGGQDVLERIQTMPRGMLAVTRVLSNLSLSNAMYEAFGTNTVLRKGRVYRIRYNFGTTTTSGAVRVNTYIKYGTTNTLISSETHSTVGPYNSEVVFNADEFSFTDGAAVRLTTLIQTIASGATGTFYANAAAPQGGAFMTLEDMGQTVPIYNITVSNTAPTPTTVVYDDLIHSTGAVGLRPDGNAAPDGRLTLGGYNRYGTDMAEYLWYPMPNLNWLSGSTVEAAHLNITPTSNEGGGTVAFWCDAAVNGTTGRQNLFSTTIGVGGESRVQIPPAVLQRLVGKGGIFLAPYYPGQSASYAYFSKWMSLQVRYRK